MLSDDVKQRLDDLRTIIELVDKARVVLIISYICEIPEENIYES